MRVKQKRQLEGSFYQFFLASWPITNPTADFVDNWHIKLYCDLFQEMLTRLIRGENKKWDLCINTPPKSLKSFIFSVAGPAWAWTRAPQLKFISCSHSPVLAVRDCRRSRDLIMSDWYQERWGRNFKLVSDASEFYRNNKQGERRVTSPRMAATGHQADIIIADDPNAADDRYSQADRDMVIRWWDETMWSRLDNQDKGFRIVIQQRIDGNDLTGHIQKEYSDKYVFVVLPADLSEGAHAHPRQLEEKYNSGLLFPARIGRKVLDEGKDVLRLGYSGQYNQVPIVVGGRYFKEEWVHWITKEQLPPMSEIVISVDASFTSDASSCPASIQAWGHARPNFYMLHDFTARMGALETGQAIERIAKIFPGCIIVIEKAANGYFLIETLKKKYPVFPFDPKRFGGKEQRAESVGLLWQTGNVFILDTPQHKKDYITEIMAFPNSEFKDRCDAMSQCLIYFTRIPHGRSGPTDTGGY